MDERYTEVANIIKDGFDEQVQRFTNTTAMSHKARSISTAAFKEMVRTSIAVTSLTTMIHKLTVTCLKDGIHVNIGAEVEEPDTNIGLDVHGLSYVKFKSGVWNYNKEIYYYNDPDVIDKILDRHMRWLQETW